MSNDRRDIPILKMEANTEYFCEMIFDEPIRGVKNGRAWAMYKVLVEGEEVRFFVDAKHDQMLTDMGLSRGSQFIIMQTGWKDKERVYEAWFPNENPPPAQQGQGTPPPRSQAPPEGVHGELPSPLPRQSMNDLLAGMDLILAHVISQWEKKLEKESVQSIAQSIFNAAVRQNLLAGCAGEKKTAQEEGMRVPPPDDDDLPF